MFTIEGNLIKEINFFIQIPNIKRTHAIFSWHSTLECESIKDFQIIPIFG